MALDGLDDEGDAPLVRCAWHEDREAVAEVRQYADPRDYIVLRWNPACDECAADSDKADERRPMNDNV